MNKKSIIYYFSGTGNSLAIARDIAGKINANLVFIPSMMNKKSIETDANTIGIVFPTYFVFNGGIPFIIEKFIGKLKNITNKYLFAVCTYGYIKDSTIENLNNIIKKSGGKLSSGFAVKMPYNYTSWNGDIASAKIEKQKKMFNKWEQKIDNIVKLIVNNKESKFETDGAISKAITNILNGIGAKEYVKSHYQVKAGYKKSEKISFKKILPLMDKSFKYNNHCNGCKICLNICPVNNIKMINMKPVWQNNCEQCFACLQWCPEAAIQFSDKKLRYKRYHHPKIKLSDIINQKKVDNS